MEQIILLCLISTCLLTIHAQKLLFSPKWGPIGYKEHDDDDRTAMDEIIKANEFQASRLIDGSTTLREGDIAVSSGRRSKVCFARSCLWSKSVDGHVYVAYSLSPKYSEMETKMIKKGMDGVEKGTCVSLFLELTSETTLKSSQRLGVGPTSVRVSPDCLRVGVISHEFMHALGFVHEQSRLDRDNYVTIMWPNIWRDRLRNFEKFKTGSLDLPYDYGSIMHFGMFAYSQDGSPTIIPKNNQNSKDIKLGQVSSLSRIDKMKINKLYKCGTTDE
ncbi:Low choriolytic enzyme [Dissostichus eleginoides]|uniref:Metalloendopeptidase n=1 Tax=Dissostichus eleginoides TaxID=100907 RepID=A0AAD9CLD2_DISEL|nr:Low choriolytic enzyme [Dissostichus eleginoides]